MQSDIFSNSLHKKKKKRKKKKNLLSSGKKATSWNYIVWQ